MIRLRAVITGVVWPAPENEPFDLVLAADLARLADRQRERGAGMTRLLGLALVVVLALAVIWVAANVERMSA